MPTGWNAIENFGHKQPIKKKPQAALTCKLHINKLVRES